MGRDSAGDHETHSALCLVLSTAPSAEIAEKIARSLVEERIVGCVNIVPGLTSVFEWGDKICTETEVLLVMKTLKPHLAALEVRLHELHPYDTPEFVVVDPCASSAGYLGWLSGVLGSA